MQTYIHNMFKSDQKCFEYYLTTMLFFISGCVCVLHDSRRFWIQSGQRKSTKEISNQQLNRICAP